MAEPFAEEETEWRTEGSAYVGREFLRTMVDVDGIEHKFSGEITGWLSADESNFFTKKGKPAALWRFVPYDANVTPHELEEHEVKEMAAEVRMCLCCERSCSRRGLQPRAPPWGRGSPGRAAASCTCLAYLL